LAKRLFVALPLARPIVAELTALVHLCRRHAPFVRWVHPEHLHITLKFLGDVEAGQEEQVTAELEALQELPPFQFNLADVGAFPDQGRPRVIWTGIADGRQEVAHLAGQVDLLLSRCGFEREERPFSSHVTIGRVKDGGDFHSLWNAMKANTFVGARCTAQEVQLVHSTLTPRGPIYAPLASFALRGHKDKS